MSHYSLALLGEDKVFDDYNDGYTTIMDNSTNVTKVRRCRLTLA